VPRCVGEGNEIRLFNSWCGKILVGIKDIPETTESRCISIPMKKKTVDEKIKKLSMRITDPFPEVRQKLAQFAQDNIEDLKMLDPAMPEGLGDRDQDNWFPLFCIADLAGGKWPGQARKVAVDIAQDKEEESYSILLLEDTRTAFEEKKVDKISTEELIEYLKGVPERPWPEYGRAGKLISPRQLNTLLKHFKIKPGQLWIDGKNIRGFQRKDFEDAWSRYLCARTLDSIQTKDLPGFLSARNNENLADRNKPNPNEHKGSSILADRKQVLEEKKEKSLFEGPPKQEGLTESEQKDFADYYEVLTLGEGKTPELAEKEALELVMSDRKPMEEKQVEASQ